MFNSLKFLGRSLVKPRILSMGFSKKKEYLPVVTKIMTNKEAIDSDIGLKNFMMKTYIYTGSGILITMSGGILLSHFPEFFSYDLMLGGGFLSSIIGTLGMGFSNYKVCSTNLINENGSTEVLHSENTKLRSFFYFLSIGGITLTTSPILAYANLTGILLPSMLYTSLIFGGATYYAKTKKVGELNSMGPALYGGLTGLVGCGLVGIGSTLIFGPNIFSIFTHSIDLYAGIPLFAGFIAYDTHKTIEMYNDRDPDHLGCSLQLYLDFINILIRMVEIISKVKDD